MKIQWWGMIGRPWFGSFPVFSHHHSRLLKIKNKNKSIFMFMSNNSNVDIALKNERRAREKR